VTDRNRAKELECGGGCVHKYCALGQRRRREAQPKLEGRNGGIDGPGRQGPSAAPTIEPGDDARQAQWARFQITRDEESGRPEAEGGPRFGGHRSARGGRQHKRTGPGQARKTEGRDTKEQTRDGRRRRGTTKTEPPEAPGQHGRAGGTNKKPPEAATGPGGREIKNGGESRPKTGTPTKKPEPAREHADGGILTRTTGTRSGPRERHRSLRKRSGGPAQRECRQLFRPSK